MGKRRLIVNDRQGHPLKTSTRIKETLNSLLKPMGFQISSTALEVREHNRLLSQEERGHWKAARYLGGLDLNPSGYLEFLQDVVAPFRADYTKFPCEPRDESTYYFTNGYFGPVDAEIYYSLIRHLKPASVLEVGSGSSSRLARQAIKDGNLSTRLTCIDPCPRVAVTSFADEHLQHFVEELDASTIIQRLACNDILFIDSSHLVTTAGDVPFLFLEVLPYLQPGVVVHIHDIFFPYDYPREWVIENRWGWNEQYLAQAYLAHNSAYEIIWPSYFMHHEHAGALRELFPSLVQAKAAPPTSLWIRRRAG